MFLGLYHCAKFGWNRCSSFDNMKLSVFCMFGLKTSIHAAKVVFKGKFYPLSGCSMNETFNMHTNVV